MLDELVLPLSLEDDGLGSDGRVGLLRSDESDGEICDVISRDLVLWDEDRTSNERRKSETSFSGAKVKTKDSPIEASSTE